MVDFPDAERPVNQIVKPFCLRNELRSARERDGCQVMLLSLCQRVDLGVMAGYSGVLTLPFWKPHGRRDGKLVFVIR